MNIQEINFFNIRNLRIALLDQLYYNIHSTTDQNG